MKEKLTSRKLWVAIAGVIAGVVLIANKNTIEGTTTIVASILGYLAAEGYIDAKAVNNKLQQTKDENTEE
jgi:uncharacterized membrane protein YebE (DUF533 family)